MSRIISRMLSGLVASGRCSERQVRLNWRVSRFWRNNPKLVPLFLSQISSALAVFNHADSSTSGLPRKNMDREIPIQFARPAKNMHSTSLR
jgi:hypothetical protein